MKGEQGYLDVLKSCLESDERQTRNGVVRSSFGHRMEFNLKDGFPLLTTKKVYFKGVVEELLWFLRGETNSKILSDKGVHIWDGNTTREFLDARGLDYPDGEAGPIYGHQMRNFNGEYPVGEKKTGVDQLRSVLEQLLNDPTSRRIVLSTWNPYQHDLMCLHACHITYQWYVDSRGISCQLLCRSQDIALGTPFNIASVSLLTMIFGYLLDIPVDRVIVLTGDTHLYASHVHGANEQICREPLQFPNLTITKAHPEKNVDAMIKWIETLKYEDFLLESYKCHPPIKYQMVA
jgi:thymidylate synthase